MAGWFALILLLLGGVFITGDRHPGVWGILERIPNLALAAVCVYLAVGLVMILIASHRALCKLRESPLD